MPSRKKSSSSSDDKKDLATEVGRLADAVEKENRYRRRLLGGLIFGAATAIGASVIAALIILLLVNLFSFVGIANFLDSSLNETLEKQIQQSAPPR